MMSSNSPIESPYLDLADWSAEDILAVTNYALLTCFHDWQADQSGKELYKDEVKRLQQRIPAEAIRSYMFSEEGIALLGVFVHINNLPAGGLAELLF